MRTWLKAGLIGGVIQILLTIPSIAVYVLPSNVIGLISCLICLPFFLVYFLPGILAARWMAPPRTVNQAAKDGTLAGLVAGGLDGIVTMIISILLMLLGLPQQYLSRNFSPQDMEVLDQIGFTSLFTPGAQIAQSVCFLFVHLALGVGIGCLSAVIYAGLFKGEPKELVAAAP